MASIQRDYYGITAIYQRELFKLCLYSTWTLREIN